MAIECPLCTESSELITTLLHLHVHCINAHPNQFHSCPWCTVPFTTIHALKTHAKNCSKFNKHELHEGEIDALLVNGNQCLVCMGKYRSNEAAIKHYKEQHLYFSYICGECEQYFQRKSALDNHHAIFHARPFEARVPSVSSANSSTPVSREQGNKEHASTSVSRDQGNKEHSSTRVSREQGNKEHASTSVNREQGNKEHSSTRVSRNAIKTENVLAAKQKKKNRAVKNMSRRDKRHFMTGYYRKHCVECNINFPNTNCIVEHFKSAHKTKVFICSCGNAYLSDQALCRHRLVCTKSRAPSKNKKCRVNPNATKVEKRMFMKAFNRQRCMECEQTFPTVREIADHFKVKHRINVLLCGMCDKGHLSDGARYYHRKIEHNICNIRSYSLRVTSRGHSEGAQSEDDAENAQSEDDAENAQSEDDAQDAQSENDVRDVQDEDDTRHVQHEDDVQEVQGEYSRVVVKKEIESDHSISPTPTTTNFNANNMQMRPNPCFGTNVIYDLTLDD